jgi:hypothetical protein
MKVEWCPAESSWESSPIRRRDVTSAGSSPARRSSTTPRRAAWSTGCSAGLPRAGVDRVLMMPAGSGLSEALRRRLRAENGRLPDLEVLDQRLEETAADTGRRGPRDAGTWGERDRRARWRRHEPDRRQALRRDPALRALDRNEQRLSRVAGGDGRGPCHRSRRQRGPCRRARRTGGARR